LQSEEKTSVKNKKKKKKKKNLTSEKAQKNQSGGSRERGIGLEEIHGYEKKSMTSKLEATKMEQRVQIKKQGGHQEGDRKN